MREMRMTQIKSIALAAAVTGSTLAGTSRAATLSDFEAPTDTAGSTYAGVDDWTIYSGVAFRARQRPGERRPRRSGPPRYLCS